MQNIINHICQAPKEQIENLCHQLVLISIMYATTNLELKFQTNPTQSYTKKCIKYYESIKALAFSSEASTYFQKFYAETQEGFENNEEEDQSYVSAEMLLSRSQVQVIINQRLRKPTSQEDSLIQSLLQSLREKDNILKQRKKYPSESLQQYLECSTPYEVWKAIEDIKGPYFFFEVFENQNYEGINYHGLNKMMMCSKAYEREYSTYKRLIDEQLNILKETTAKEVSTITQVTNTIYPEPLCVVIKDEEYIKCKCDSRSLRLIIEKMRWLNKIKRVCGISDVKSLFESQQIMEDMKDQFEQEYNQLLYIIDILRNQNNELKCKIKEIEMKIEQAGNQDLEMQVLKLKQQLQKIQIEKGSLIVKIKQQEYTINKLKEMDSDPNKQRITQEMLDMTNKSIKVVEQVFKPPKTATVGCNTISQNFNEEIKLISQSAQLKMTSLEFLRKDIKHQSTQTELKKRNLQQLLNSNIHHQLQNQQVQKYMLCSQRLPPQSQSNRYPSLLSTNQRTRLVQVSKQGERSMSQRQPSPVFDRLFKDFNQKQQRHHALQTRINQSEQSHWEEVLSLLHLLNNDRRNMDIRTKIHEKMEFYKDQILDRSQLPRMKLKEKVPESFIESLINYFHSNRRIALNSMLKEFQGILAVNKISRSVDLQFTI